MLRGESAKMSALFAALDTWPYYVELALWLGGCLLVFVAAAVGLWLKEEVFVPPVLKKWRAAIKKWRR